MNMCAGDFDLAVAEDGKAYYYFERVHSELICADLTDDYTNVTGYYSTHFPRVSPPDVREAPAHFRRKGKALSDHFGNDRVPAKPIGSGGGGYLARAFPGAGRSTCGGQKPYVLPFPDLLCF